MSMIKTAFKSAINFTGLVFHRSLILHRSRLGHAYHIGNSTYRIFRETENISSVGETTVLVVGFRLKLIGSNPALHWLFQRISILTTPFWSGMAGFKTKLWMVDSQNKNYLGIYDWKGQREARAYLTYLLPILRFFSRSKTVRANELRTINFEEFLHAHRATESKFDA